MFLAEIVPLSSLRAGDDGTIRDEKGWDWTIFTHD
jgi:hypothetical protein